MPSPDFVTPLRRDVLLAAVALLLLSAPAWVSVSGLGETTYAYERAEVVVDDEDGITYANGSEVPFRTHVSEEIGCSIAFDVRPCAFERRLAANDTIPTETYTTNPSTTFVAAAERYRYVQVEGTVYETAYVPNRSVQNDDGLYRVDLALERTPPEDALRAVSRDASAENADVPPVVIEAAREGSATSHREVEVPPTPLRLDDGSYYRVYPAGSSDPAPIERPLRVVLSVGGPSLGLLVVARLSRRITVTYVGETK